MLGEAAALAASCSGCHLGNDRSAAIPSLAGLDRETLSASLAVYRSDSNGQTVMHRIARGYTTEELDAIAAFIEGDTP